jgi:hypothetical protein
MERLLSRTEVSEVLGVSTRTLDRRRSEWTAKGLDYGEVRLRGVVRFRPEKIQYLIENPSKFKL